MSTFPRHSKGVRPYSTPPFRIHNPWYPEAVEKQRFQMAASLLSPVESGEPLDPVRMLQLKMLEVYFGPSPESSDTRKRVAHFLYEAVGHLSRGQEKTRKRKAAPKGKAKCGYCANRAAAACTYCSMALCDQCVPAHERILCRMKPPKPENA